MLSKKVQRLQEQTLINEYKLSLKHYVLTTRFSNTTWQENIKYREQQSKIGCVYCTPEPIASHISSDKIIFILAR